MWNGQLGWDVLVGGGVEWSVRMGRSCGWGVWNGQLGWDVLVGGVWNGQLGWDVLVGGGVEWLFERRDISEAVSPREMSVSSRLLCFNCCLLVILLLFSSCSGEDSVSSGLSQQALPDLFEKLLRAVEKAIGFFGEDYSSLNVDGLFGIRICQGSLLMALQDCKPGRLDCPEDLVTFLTSVIQTMGDYGDKALAYIEAEDEDYYRHFLDTINSPYTFNSTFKSLGDTSAVVPGVDSTYVESDGDRCFSMVMGSYDTQDGGKYPKCSVDEQCWTMMTKPNMKGYAITHQLLYFIVIEKTGCVKEVENLIQKSSNTTVEQLERQFCRSIYSELLSEETDAIVNELRQDLFLEQIVLCGMVGFEELFPEKWIRVVLKWQKPRGCYGMTSSMMKIEAELTRVQEDEKRLMTLLNGEAQRIESNPAARKLLREKVMHGDCLAHKTGLAFGTLGVYLRYVITQLFHA
ncbi:hypothetical protein Btru_075645 [Bulinus truncatus]|nr:hypothetical protein Btru_075645 [Bulinus truncatus]